MVKFTRRQVRAAILVLIAISIVAPLTGLAWWRWKVNSAFNEAITGDSDPAWWFQFGTLSDGDHYLLSDYKRVMARLMAVADKDTSFKQRVNAVLTMRRLSVHNSSLKIRQQFLPQLVILACHDDTPPQLETELAGFISDWILSTDVSDAERQQIRNRATRFRGAEQSHWIPVLGMIGGRQETELLIQLAENDETSREAVISRSGLVNSSWKQLLPHAQAWLADPNVSSFAVDLVVLSRFPKGRESLLSAMLDERQPALTRQKAFHELARTPISLDLLEVTVRDDAIANEIDALMEFDCREHLADKRREMSERNGKRLWEELIAGLSLEYWLPNASNKFPEPVLDQVREFREQQVSVTLAALRRLAGKADLTTTTEWHIWLQQNSTATIEQSVLLELVENTPELIECAAVNRRIKLWDLGYMPENCEPIYRRWLNSSNSTVQYWACDALLKFGQSPEAVDVAIDLIGGSPPESQSWNEMGAIRLLTKCFAVNYFWDIAAWREWAKRRRAEASEREVQE